MSACFPVPHAPDAHRRQTAAGFAVIAVAVAGVAAVGGLIASTQVMDWYPALNKPDWTPPAWVFGPVWTALYGLMAVAAAVVWANRDDADVCGPTAAFAVQLGLNLGWTVFFFGLRSPLLAFLDVGVLVVAVGLTTWAFFGVSRAAGWLMVPYFAWTAFAAFLNGAILWQNCPAC